MTREQYIQLRNHNDIGSIVYIFYVDLCTQRKIKPLDIATFFLAFNQWKFAQYCVDMIIHRLDMDFKIIQVIKDNKIIKLL